MNSDDAVSEPRWLGHGTLHFPGRPALVVDPWRWRHDELEADAVLLTGERIDVACAHDVDLVSGPGTRVLGSAAAITAIGGCGEVAEPGATIQVGEARIEVLCGAGPTRGEEPCPFLRPEALRTYRIHQEGRVSLVLGASMLLPEHILATPPDVAWFAVGGMVWPDVDAAIEAAVRLRPRRAVPTFWGDLTERHDVAKRFIEGCAAEGVFASVG